MSVLVIVVGAVRIICVDRGAVWSCCQLLAIFMSNGEFYFKCKGIMRLALLFSRCCLSRCDCEQSSLRLPFDSGTNQGQNMQRGM